MASTRYTIVIANRATGVVRRCTVRSRPTVSLVLFIVALPILMGLGARWSGLAEVAGIRTASARLQMENASYRAATGELASEIDALQSTISELGSRAALDPASAKAINSLPAVLKARAMGGGTDLDSARLVLSSAVTSPESTFGVLRALLGSLENRLKLVRTDVERREALAAATPSIWPAHGWLSATFGNRSDPFTGDPTFHAALDISTERGRPVYATAEGVVASATYSGAYGNLVVIEHDFGLTTRYGHLSRFAVRLGDRVTRGDVIGYVGATGRATGAHLHYEVWANDKPLNPLRLLITPPLPQ